MRTRHARSAILLPLLVFSLTLLTGPALSGNGWTLDFPEPPHPDAIGTQVGAVNTWIRRVTISQPAFVHRAGLVYSEIRGSIEGVGWGGQPTTLRCHYSVHAALRPEDSAGLERRSDHVPPRIGPAHRLGRTRSRHRLQERWPHLPRDGGPIGLRCRSRPRTSMGILRRQLRRRCTGRRAQHAARRRGAGVHRGYADTRHRRCDDHA